MRNILEIPQNTKTAVLILRDNDNGIVCATVHGQPSELEALTLLLGNFVSTLQRMEDRTDETGNYNDVLVLEELRQSFKTMELEEILSSMAKASMTEESF
jgi:hypothetical protein